MAPELTQAFFDECAKTFAFLVLKHGFKSPTLDVAVHYATVTFMGRNIAIEWIFDEREAWVEAKVAKVLNNHRLKPVGSGAGAAD
jgi:hypothetical protein